MKRINFQQVILGMIFLVFFNSCTKDECQISPNDTGLEASVRSEESILIETTEYIHNGTEVKKGDQIRETETTNELIGYQGNNYVFDNDTLLRNWTLEYTDRTRIREVLDSMNYLKTFADTPDNLDLKKPFNGEAYVRYYPFRKMYL
ncbi:MAG: hypothetical protein IPN29_17565 [Saprospiraceae bacterium]|nr:hypothetical protein [Saprospiraceae bacterium]